MYFAALFTALVAGTLAVEPILPNNDWIHFLGKKDTLDQLLKPLQPVLGWTNLGLLGRRNSFEPWLPINDTIIALIHSLGKKNVLPLDSVIKPIDWSLLQPLLLSKKRDILQGSSTTFNPLILSKRILDLVSIFSPGVDGFLTLQQQLEQLLAGKRNLQSILTLLQLEQLASKRNLQSILTQQQLEQLASKRNLQSILTQQQLEQLASKRNLHSILTQQQLEQLASKRNLQSILTPIDIGIIPFNPNLILSKKRDVVFDPLNTNPLIISKKRDILFDPLHPNVISKKNIWNPLIDILLPPIKDVV